ncbi:MAG TPA: ABC transporter permease [Bryobacteraceae bacterium]|jgi:lipopolysaccharide transport system permease protein
MAAGTIPSGIPLQDSAAVTRIEASSSWPSLRLRELIQFRELLYSLIWRDIKVRYKHTVLGAGWVVLQPLLTMAVFSVFLGRLAKVPSDGTPYPLFALAGLVPWMFFANGIGQASASLISNSNLIRKVYFPRLMIPASTILAGLLDLGLSVAVLGIVMLYYRTGLTARAPLALAYLALVLIITMGVGLWLAALTIQFRDVRYVVPFLSQFWMFATPVVYPSSLLASRWHVLYGLNPLVGAIEGFRWALLSTGTAPGPMVAVSAAVALAALLSGAFYFRRIEKSFADVL